ncbi:MAG: FAD-dependent oxidoreductase [Promethearchaeota archaeon]
MSELEVKLFDQSWNYQHRADIIKRFKETRYDLIVIGAGITGVGVAREATMRGLKVAVVDMQDFAAGTSSRSSKLGHGGIRYLGHGDMDLVQESATERNWMVAHIPHLVRPLPFMLVVLKGGKYKKRDIVGAGKIYDFLGNKDTEFKIYKKHKWYKAEEIFELEPEFIREGNEGGMLYYDTNLDDARLTIETLKEAVIRNTDAVNYCEVLDYLMNNGKIIGVKCKDLINNTDFEIKGTLVINATGIWTDNLVKNYPDDVPEPLIRPTKGVHIQYKRKHVKHNHALGLRSISDNRFFFVIPRGDYTILGTTDTDYKGDLKNPFCTKEDTDYLIQSVKYHLPAAELEYENILSTYAGIRPLVMQKGKSESDVSRKHIIFFSDDGLLTITGGKLTAWRAMAEDLFRYVEEKNIFPDIKREKNFSKQKFIIGLDKEDWLKEYNKSGVKLDDDIVDHIYQQYGKGAIKILEMIKEDGNLKARIMDENDFIKAEILYVLRYEMTPHLIDVFCRRTEMSLWIRHDKARLASEKVAELMAKEYSWSEDTKNIEIENYIDYVKKTVAFIK